jgi:hypothetical protein
MSQYDGDDTPITASAGSAFYSALNVNHKCLVLELPETGLLRVFPNWDVDHLFFMTHFI